MSWGVEPLRGVNVGTWIDAGKLATLRSWGTRLLRVQLVGAAFHPVEKDGQWTFADASWTALDAFLERARVADMRVIIDLHERYTIFPADRAIAGWQNPANIAKLEGIWRTIAHRYKDERAVIHAYEILNEPEPLDDTPERIQAGADAWTHIASTVATAIRKIDTHHSIIVGTTGFCAPARIALLDYERLSRIPGIVYSVHMYKPHEFTEQGNARRPQWPFGRDGVSGYQYPGIVDLGWTTDISEKTPVQIDRAWLAEALRPVFDFQEAHPEARIFIGEFGAIRWAPRNADGEDSAWRYLLDCMQLFAAKGRRWSWAVHAFNFSAEEAYTGLNRDNIKESTQSYSDTNRLRLYRHYVNPDNDILPPPAYDKHLPD